MDNEEIKEIKNDIGKQAEFESLASSKSGKSLIEQLQKAVIASTINLCSKYGELSHIQLISLVAGLNEKIELLKILSGAGKKKKELRIMYEELVKKEIE